MFTIASLPKPFIGHIGIIQRNAIASWLQIKPRPHIILFGREEGVSDNAREFSLQHIPDLQSNMHGMPYLSDAIRQAEAASPFDYLCFSNCDVMLFPSIAGACDCIRKRFESFLLVGECRNLDVRVPIDFSDSEWVAHWEAEARKRGVRRGRNADYFLFRRGMYPVVPPIIHGRAFYDNWILYETRRRHFPLVDVTPVSWAIHQNHFYGHVAGETLQTHKGDEAHENLRLLGGYNHVYWITDATHLLTPAGMRRRWAGTFLLRQRWAAFRRVIGRFFLCFLRRIGLHP